MNEEHSLARVVGWLVWSVGPLAAAEAAVKGTEISADEETASGWWKRVRAE